ncbi:hypothetical protein F53441_11544 [Fusarium austroafricanum]|uniref:Uncharacterized protein n=1 Tax=Fusarium austroafricanum TaxID=2364996 RepID=A0A8H4NPS2_9HYPO|nr:hypothetical protein F53441_11544 [Fusarium austroafricanum]
MNPNEVRPADAVVEPYNFNSTREEAYDPLETYNVPFLIIDKNYTARKVLRNLLRRRASLRFTFARGQEISTFEYEVVFARGVDLPPLTARGYRHCGFIQFCSKKKRVLLREDDVSYQIYCKPSAQHILQRLQSEVQENRQGYDLIFALDSSSFLAESSPYQAPWGYDSQKRDGNPGIFLPLISDEGIESGWTSPSWNPPSPSRLHIRQEDVANTQKATGLSIKKEKQASSTSHSGKEDQSAPLVHGSKKPSTSDRAKTHPLDWVSVDSELDYFMAFVSQLAKDLRTNTNGMAPKNVGLEYLNHVLEEFAWKLHGESSNSFQILMAAVIYRKSRVIVDFLERKAMNIAADESESVQSSPSSETGHDDVHTILLREAEEAVLDYLRFGNSRNTGHASWLYQDRQAFQASQAYKWLLTKIGQHNRLWCDKPSILHKIGTELRNKLKTQPPFHKIGTSRPSTSVEMTYSLPWDLLGFMQSSGISRPFAKALPNILCLTGNWDQAQALTVAEYMKQTWPQSGSTVITRLQELLCNIEGEKAESYTISGHSSCLESVTASLSVGSDETWYRITVTGGYHAVSEVGEQLAWLAAALRPGPENYIGFVSSSPSIHRLDIGVDNNKRGQKGNLARGECVLGFSQDLEPAYNPNPGFCWERLFCSPNIVRGYPILRRSVPNSGLEVSLGHAATIVGSSEVVQWDEKLLIKGFNMLMVATLLAADVMVWHLLISGEPEQRISYVDPRLDELGIRNSGGASLEHVEGKRHIIGWCSKAKDLCGHATANHEVKPASLTKVPASMVIDKLYIEGGSPVTAGFLFDINKKEKPFWLQREKDYPSLLNWVKLQPIVFYDVEERRAWLVDGASALLHLVRISLHRDINDPESAYDWVYDASKLKDQWPGTGSRQAALETLKSWENRALSVYIIDKYADASGMPITKYSTFEERVKNILHSIEILVDRQAKVVSQDGIKISQTLDLRRDIIGFDIVDIIDPLVPIYPRVQHINPWGRGWVDLIPIIGITTIFGRAFGDLIRADEPDGLCPSWRSVPVGKDYLATSVSTMQMLHEKRLLRMEPGLVGGEITKKITWAAAKESVQCSCIKGQGINSQVSGVECNHNPVQFLVKRWWSRTVPHGLKPVQLGSLDSQGAVIFGHTVLGLRTGDKSTSKQAEDDGTGSTTSGEGSLQASASGSSASQTTSITVPTVGSSSQEAMRVQQSSNDASGNVVNEGKKNKRWSKFKSWVKR